MIAADVLSLIIWWFVLLVITIIFLPLTARIFSQFLDKGYIFSKILGMALVSYTLFLFGSLHITPFTQPVLMFLLILFATGIYWWQRNELKTLVARPTIFYFLLEEILFLAMLYFWSYIRTFAPDIHGLEKYMDFGFINSILRSEYFPPKDMWFTPFSINYYYFGHLVTAMLTKLSGLSSSLTFNLMVASCMSFCFTTCFSLGANLTAPLFTNRKVFFLKVLFAGLLCGALVAFSGNLHTIYTFFKPYTNENPVPPTALAFSPFTFPNAYWYPNATRFIHNTIHEFPIYSWVVSDLHGHVLDIPFVLLTIGVLLSIFLKFADHNPLPETSKQHKKIKQKKNISLLENGFQPVFRGRYSLFDIRYSLLIGFLLAVMYMTNAWDGLIYLLLTGGVFLFLSLQYFSTTVKKTGELLQNALLPTGIATGLSFVSFIIFSLPFSLGFKPFVSGIGVLCAPKFLTDKGKLGPFLFEANHCQHSPLWQLAILYGFFVFFTVCYLLFIRTQKKLLRADLFVFLLICLSFLLIIIPEFIYVKDIYPEHYRANTMFKLVFQSFMMLSLSVGFIIVRVLSSFKQARNSARSLIAFIAFFLSSLVLLTLVFIYPFMAIKSYYNNLQTPLGLNGTKYLETLYPDDAKAINWINQHIPGQPVILEAQGDSYTDYGRISTNTGLPTVLGWTVHEWLWRGTYDVPAPRITEVQNLYESPDIQLTKNLINKYHIEYVYLGNLEHQKYPTLDETKWQQLGRVVYNQGDVTIYKL